MVIFGTLIWHYQSFGILKPIRAREWILLILGSLIVIGAYIQDYMQFMRKEFSLIEIFSPTGSDNMMDYAMSYVPAEFNWWVFWVGELIILVAIGFWYVSHRGPQRVSQSDTEENQR
jgi:hypothetical protein